MIRPLLVLLVTAGAVLAQAQPRFDDLEVCSLCHTRLPVEREDSFLGPSALWPGSMMANSARDPYWRAKVRSETSANPKLAAVIEDTCLRCHAPMQQYDRRSAGERLALKELNPIGEQGVGCTVCHQITPRALGTKASFEAGFTIADDRQVYGPHTGPFSHPMEMHSGYTPAEGQHILESSLCGTCHTVITPTVDVAGNVVGEFVEQAPYLEWLVSDYPSAGQSCQSCHLPVLEDSRGREIPAYIAHNPMGWPFPPTQPRTPFGQHYLAGGNTQVLRMLRELFPDEAPQIARQIANTNEQLAGALSLELEAEHREGRIELDVTVLNNTGHKLPTGYPSRRIWLRVLVTDKDGQPIFESGSQASLSSDGSPVEPHRSRIHKPEQVMIYEAELGDTTGTPTTSLLRAATYIKDNRLLPVGFDLGKPLPDGIEPRSIAPAGVKGDARFLPGSHDVTYSMPAPADRAPFRIQVEALYQSIKPAHAAGLDAEFANLLRHGSPVVMARRELTGSGLIRERLRNPQNSEP